MLTEATINNLRRKASWADHVQLVAKGVPIFSWLDLSITELCNRSHGSPKACRFCPRIDPAVYPNQSLHMTLGTAEKIAAELHDMRYEGAIVFCGYGEPLLHPMFETILEMFQGLHVEIVTNGDRLNEERIVKLYEAGVAYIAVSLYDGPEQVAKFDERFARVGVAKEHYTLRDRWYDASADFGLKLTNRAGTIDEGQQTEVGKYTTCYYPSYQMSVDWNGDVLLCVQDWHKKLKFGNVNTGTLLDAWTNKALHKRRMQLLAGDRSGAPCAGCNAEGTCHGKEHAEAWR